MFNMLKPLTEKKTNEEEEEEEEGRPDLKHFGFVRFFAVQYFVCMSNLFNWAKQKLLCRPFRSIVETGEGVVTTVLGPFYRKFKHVPDQFLVFCDNMVDKGVQVFDKLAPSCLKEAVNRALSLINIALFMIQELVQLASLQGPGAALRYAASKSMQIALTQSLKVFTKAAQFPGIHTVANRIIPTAANLSDKYNHIVKNMIQKGFPVSGVLPVGPIEEIAKAFKIENVTAPFGDVAKAITETNPIGEIANAIKEANPIGEIAKVANPIGEVANAIKGANPIGNIANAIKEANPISDAANAMKEVNPIGDVANAIKGANPIGNIANAIKEADPVSRVANAMKEANPIGDIAHAINKANPIDAVKEANPVGEVANAIKEANPFSLIAKGFRSN